MSKKDIPPQKCVYINCDGASRGNPGMAAIGIYIKGEDKSTVLAEIYECVGEMTNNSAEYYAVIKALDNANEFTNKKVMIFSDSELLVRQLNGVYRVKKQHLKKLFLEVRRLEGLYKEVKYMHVKRDANSIADALANKALDEVGR